MDFIVFKGACQVPRRWIHSPSLSRTYYDVGDSCVILQDERSSVFLGLILIGRHPLHLGC